MRADRTDVARYLAGRDASSLLDASSFGHLDTVAFLVDVLCGNIDAYDRLLAAAAAAANDRYRVVGFLLDRYNVSAADLCHLLRLAAAAGSQDTVLYLVDGVGVDVNCEVRMSNLNIQLIVYKIGNIRYPISFLVSK